MRAGENCCSLVIVRAEQRETRCANGIVQIEFSLDTRDLLDNLHSVGVADTVVSLLIVMGSSSIWIYKSESNLMYKLHFIRLDYS